MGIRQVVDRRSRQRASHRDPQVDADLTGNPLVVTSHDLDGHAKPREPFQRATGICLERVDEDEDAGELQVVFVLRTDTGRAARVLHGYPDDPPPS